MTLAKRLAALTRTWPPAPAGCATCRAWWRVALASNTHSPRPERCPECGRSVPLAVVVELVGIDLNRL